MQPRGSDVIRPRWLSPTRLIGSVLQDKDDSSYMYSSDAAGFSYRPHRRRDTWVGLETFLCHSLQRKQLLSLSESSCPTGNVTAAQREADRVQSKQLTDQWLINMSTISLQMSIFVSWSPRRRPQTSSCFLHNPTTISLQSKRRKEPENISIIKMICFQNIFWFSFHFCDS